MIVFFFWDILGLFGGMGNLTKQRKGIHDYKTVMTEQR